MIDALDESGRALDTLVVYTSDQGALVGEHGWRDKRYMMEESIRVPFIVRYPNRIAAGTRIVRTTRTVDIAATFLDYAQLPLPREMQGRSWRRLVHSGDDSWDDRLYYRYWCTPGNGIVVGQEECTLWRPAHWGMRTPTHKVIFTTAHGPHAPIARRGASSCSTWKRSAREAQPGAQRARAHPGAAHGGDEAAHFP